MSEKSYKQAIEERNEYIKTLVLDTINELEKEGRNNRTHQDQRVALLTVAQILKTGMEIYRTIEDHKDNLEKERDRLEQERDELSKRKG